jgi:hypothetical protein
MKSVFDRSSGFAIEESVVRQVVLALESTHRVPGLIGVGTVLKDVLFAKLRQCGLQPPDI